MIKKGDKAQLNAKILLQIDARRRPPSSPQHCHVHGVQVGQRPQHPEDCQRVGQRCHTGNADVSAWKRWKEKEFQPD